MEPHRDSRPRLSSRAKLDSLTAACTYGDTRDYDRTLANISRKLFLRNIPGL